MVAPGLAPAALLTLAQHPGLRLARQWFTIVPLSNWPGMRETSILKRGKCTYAGLATQALLITIDLFATEIMDQLRVSTTTRGQPSIRVVLPPAALEWV